MAPILELQRDKSFRFRLILICLGVALLVSAIYVVVSYRLSSDLGIKTELSSLQKQTQLLHAELVDNENNPVKRLEYLVQLIYLSDHANDSKFYLEANGKNIHWSLQHNLQSEQIKTLKAKLTLTANQTPPPSSANGVESLDDERFLWQTVEGQGYKIVVIKSAHSIDAALRLVVRRLSITFFIVFWLAAWLAITLSSWMTQQVQSKNDALTRLATHDSLTGLPNRLFLTNAMQSIMPETLSSSMTLLDDPLKQPISGSLLAIDLDKFKEVNDAFGHAAGDILLKKVAQRLTASLDDNQILVRIGGDEFVVWAANLELEDAILLAKKLVSVCDEPIMIRNLAINTGASIGISHYPTHAQNAESLMINADIAMYDAKQKHSGWSLFNERDTALDRQRLHLRADLGEAFLQKQIKLYYQPKVELSNGHIIGVEALSRWHHPTKGILSPISFIDLIEQGGRVQEFGRYVIHNAILQLVDWQKQGVYTPIAVNLSPYNLLDPGLLNFTLELLDKLCISPNMLEIELIESSTSIDIEQISIYFHKFKTAGIKLAIDDFGTGMSSLSYISNLKVDNIKVDRSFIDNIDVDPKKQAVVSSALALAKSFNSKAIAEGIENKTQADILIQMGCVYGQGYYYAKPMPATEMLALLKLATTLPVS